MLGLNRYGSKNFVFCLRLVIFNCRLFGIFFVVQSPAGFSTFYNLQYYFVSSSAYNFNVNTMETEKNVINRVNHKFNFNATYLVIYSTPL